MIHFLKCNPCYHQSLIVTTTTYCIGDSTTLKNGNADADDGSDATVRQTQDDMHPGFAPPGFVP